MSLHEAKRDCIGGCTGCGFWASSHFREATLQVAGLTPSRHQVPANRTGRGLGVVPGSGIHKCASLHDGAFFVLQNGRSRSPEQWIPGTGAEYGEQRASLGILVPQPSKQPVHGHLRIQTIQLGQVSERVEPVVGSSLVQDVLFDNQVAEDWPFRGRFGWHGSR